MAGKWKEAFLTDNPIYLELGCGKGVFTAKLARQNPDINLIAIELITEMLLVTKRNIEKEYLEYEKEIDNVLITTYNVEQILNIMNEADTVDRIYINFCNPWPRAGHKKRRLTHTRQLEKYKVFLNKGAQIHFKTDDDDLFFESIKYFEESGFEIIYKTLDLYSDDNVDNIVTEHELKFTRQGIKIKKLIALLT